MSWPQNFRYQWERASLMLRTDSYVPDAAALETTGPAEIAIRHDGLDLYLPIEIRTEEVRHTLRDLYRSITNKGTLGKVIHMPDDDFADRSFSLHSENAARKFVTFVEQQFQTKANETRGIISSASHRQLA